ncbi:DNA polymerase/3'-5' exonuclease PolX [Thalassorhabdus alkalitolerans]|uniref:DNA-directed DNA polymerase n=1 Tax=Thalassorhabdus alkalitolerans TaxID=2282697 RepID=A0ABW0YM33_9BACI
MRMNKKEMIQLLEKIAVYMEIKGENPFKVSAYRKAAGALEKDERTLDEIHDPSELSGIGKGTASVIEELRETGTSELLEELKKDIPEGLLALLKLPGLGGKKIGRLYQELGVVDVQTLKAACEEEKVQKLSGFGAKSEEKILATIEEIGSRPERLPLAYMMEIADWVDARLEDLKGIIRYERAGSLRRIEETVKDLDYIIAVEDAEEVRRQLVAMESVTNIIADGTSKVSLEVSFDFTVGIDFRLVKDEEFATTLHHFTGSKEHNVLMRQLAKAQGEKVSEYGVESLDSGKVKTFASEKEFYKHFNLHYIPPEARSGLHETEIFKEPKELLQINDIRADLHMHTTWSDGGYSVKEMAEAARERGYEYIAITDHSKFLQVANGLNEDRLKRQQEEIQRVNEAMDDITIFSGIEMDIRPDGTLDFEDETLMELDFVIASIHSSFSQKRETIMKRLETALTNPYVNLIAHPTGRLIGRREGYDVDVEQLIEKAAKTGTALELNANPHRLDLSAKWLKLAAEKGAVISINTDSHQTSTFKFMEVGTGFARKAMLTKDQVLNTWSKDDFLSFVNKKQNNSGEK